VVSSVRARAAHPRRRDRRSSGLVVDRAYEDKAPYAFTGTVNQVVFDLQPAPHTKDQGLHQHAAVQAVGQGAGG
jgi:hypothetical protein